jgi:hypothetical protein
LGGETASIPITPVSVAHASRHIGNEPLSWFPTLQERITGHGLESRFSLEVCFNWTPSIVPRGDDHDVYLVVDDLGRLGRVRREADFEATDFETVVTDLLDGQYKRPIGVFAFNRAEGWSRDASSDVATELRRRCDLQLREVPESLQDFVAAHASATPG